MVTPWMAYVRNALVRVAPASLRGKTIGTLFGTGTVRTIAVGDYLASGDVDVTDVPFQNLSADDALFLAQAGRYQRWMVFHAVAR